MGLTEAKQTCYSGLKAQTSRVSKNADNTAHADTIGYKLADTQFSTLVISSGRNSYESGGVNTRVRRDITRQGRAVATGRAGDAMIDGKGFFRVQDMNGAEYMTRGGSFDRDKDGYLQNTAGYYLLDSNGQRIQIKDSPTDLVPPQTTTRIDMNVNLKASEKTLSGWAGFDPANPTSFSQKKSVTIFDSQGKTVNLDIYYAKTADNQWQMAVYKGGAVVGNSNQTLKFDNKGQLLSPAGNMTLDLSDAADGVGTVNLNFYGDGGKRLLTQQGDSYAFATTADGMKSGYYRSFTFSKDGEVMVTYSNGQTLSKGVVGMMTVEAPNRLTVLSGTVFQANHESGAVIRGRPGSGSFGTLEKEVLEQSNADTTDALIDTIQAQSEYMANARVWQTCDELMRVISNFGR